MNVQYNWYNTFFTGMSIELWDNAVPLLFTEKEVEFILSFALSTSQSRARVLDVPCGSGRHVIPLAEAGLKVCGIDIAEENIRNLKREKADRHLDFEIVQADILEYNLAQEFDLAICMGNSFAMFGHDMMKSFIKKIFNALTPGGKFLINTGSAAESILPNLKDKDWYELNDIIFLIENRYHPEQSVLESNMIFIKEGHSERKTAYHFIYTIAEIRELLLGNGFSSFEIYSGLNKEEYNFKNDQAYIIARK